MGIRKAIITTVFTASIICSLFCKGKGERNRVDIENERSYPTPFAKSPLLERLVNSVARQKNSPDTADTFFSEYDYVVVGAGSAGSVVAARLSENPLVSVLLLEAGGQPPYVTDIPVASRSFLQTNLDWNYTTVPQRHAARGLVDKRVPWPKGKVLGGSSIWNAMLYIRGNREDYDDWERGGATGWSYRDVLPYFFKSEDNKNRDIALNGYHGISGPLTVERPRYTKSSVRSATYESGSQMGYPFVDCNGRQQLGFTDFQGTLRDGQRCSTAKAYLVPAQNRHNLNIVTHAHVNRISINNGKAEGVEFNHNNRSFKVKARSEVISSAGTVNSAKLLMLSGIGPKDHLNKHNITVLADLPVGENFQDHCGAYTSYVLNDSVPNFLMEVVDPNNIETYINNRTGPLSSTEGCVGMAFLKAKKDEPLQGKPDYELYMISVSDPTQPNVRRIIGITDEVYKQVYADYSNRTTVLCIAQQTNPKSRGTVKLQSANPYDMPLIDPNYFENKFDVFNAIAGMKKCREIAASEPFRKLGARVFDNNYPGCGNDTENEDAYLECQLRSVVFTQSHEVGTCKMGRANDPTTVLDPRLRVKGIKNLRVVDGSVMPTIVSGNTNAPIIMIAEKGADMIKVDNAVRPIGL